MFEEQEYKCPICGKLTDKQVPHFPFCSARCRTIDLGNWASEAYVAHSPITEADELLDALRKQSRDE